MFSATSGNERNSVKDHLPYLFLFLLLFLSPSFRKKIRFLPHSSASTTLDLNDQYTLTTPHPPPPPHLHQFNGGIRRSGGKISSVGTEAGAARNAFMVGHMLGVVGRKVSGGSRNGLQRTEAHSATSAHLTQTWRIRTGEGRAT